MSARFVLRMARRDARASWKSLWLCGLSIAIGVGGLVAVASFRASAEDALRAQGRELLGADIDLRSRRPFPAPVEALLDSLSGAGDRVARSIRFPSMVLAPAGGHAELLEVHAVDGRWPFYGRAVTDPPGAWERLTGTPGESAAGSPRQAETTPRGPPPALVDADAAAQLGVATGDSLSVGEARFRVAGRLTSLPGESGIGVWDRARVYIPASALERTGLLRRGSIASYHAFLALGGEEPVRTFLDRHGETLRAHDVRWTTPDRQQERLAGRVGFATRFLGLVALAALFLGGIGVASAARTFARSRVRSAAILRCLGAGQGSVLSIYLAQTATVAALGSLVGVVLGLGVQALLPGLLAGLFPIRVGFVLHAGPMAAGLGIGVGSALAFALLPLLAVRDVPPMLALRRAAEARGSGLRDPWRWGALALLAGAGLALCLGNAPGPRTGLAYAGALLLLVAVLAGAGRGLAAGARRLLPRGAPYPLRQGLASLFRPHDQTLGVVVAVGFGAFLVGTLAAVQHSLLARLDVLGGPNHPDLVLFDIQPDQLDSVRALLRSGSHPEMEATPIVVARIAAIDGVDAATLRARAASREAARDSARRTADSADGGPPERVEGRDRGGGRGRGPESWALGREYRSTWRDTLTATETLVEGRWWGPSGGGDAGGGGGTDGGEAAGGEPVPGGAASAGRATSARPYEVSLSTDIARDLDVGVGDTITWDVAGRSVATRVTSLRDVDWARPALNFFAVFQPAALRDAPVTWVVLTRISDPGARAGFQTALVSAFPNVSALDLTRISAAIRKVVDAVSSVIRAMGMLSVLAGVVILLSAVASSRRQREREAVLLRTLGAETRTLRQLRLVEYASLGGVGGLVGVVLAGLAGWALVVRVFGIPYRAPVGTLLLLAVGAGAVAVAAGALLGGSALRRPPMELLRETEG